MVLVEVLLPLRDNRGSLFPESHFQTLRETLAEKFGGLTAFTRAPADGLWKDQAQGIQREDIVVFEVMAEDVDRAWWAELRSALERQFEQDEIVIRAHAIERL